MVQPPFEIFLVPTWLRVPNLSGTRVSNYELCMHFKIHGIFYAAVCKQNPLNVLKRARDHDVTFMETITQKMADQKRSGFFFQF